MAALATQITQDDEVVYKPLEWAFMEGDWHKVRVVLLGDAVHATVSDYIQHGPNLPDGRDAAVEMLVKLFGAPGASFDIKRIVVDGDLAVRRSAISTNGAALRSRSSSQCI